MTTSLASAFQLAATQDGLITTKQLRACGVTSKAQRTALQDGRLEQLEAAVFAAGGAPATWLRGIRSGLLALGPDARIGFESAAIQHGLDRAKDATTDGPFEFTTPHGSRRPLRHGTLHSTDVAGKLDALTVKGLRCSSATMTIVELAAAGVPLTRLGPMMDSAVRLRWTSVVTLTERLADIRCRGRRGVVAVDKLLPDSGGESPLERAFLKLIRRAGLPRPETQHVVRGDDDHHHVARVDFWYRERRLVVEVTGRLGHSTDTERAKDAQRRNELMDLGYRVCEYTRTQVTDSPDYVISTMSARLTRPLQPDPARRAD